MASAWVLESHILDGELQSKGNAKLEAAHGSLVQRDIISFLKTVVKQWSLAPKFILNTEETCDHSP